MFLFTQGSSQSSLENSKLIKNGLFRVAPERYTRVGWENPEIITLRRQPRGAHCPFSLMLGCASQAKRLLWFPHSLYQRRIRWNNNFFGSIKVGSGIGSIHVQERTAWKSWIHTEVIQIKFCVEKSGYFHLKAKKPLSHCNEASFVKKWRPLVYIMRLILQGHSKAKQSQFNICWLNSTIPTERKK